MTGGGPWRALCPARNRLNSARFLYRILVPISSEIMPGRLIVSQARRIAASQCRLCRARLPVTVTNPASPRPRHEKTGPLPGRWTTTMEALVGRGTHSWAHHPPLGGGRITLGEAGRHAWRGRPPPPWRGRPSPLGGGQAVTAVCHPGQLVGPSGSINSSMNRLKSCGRPDTPALR